MNKSEHLTTAIYLGISAFLLWLISYSYLYFSSVGASYRGFEDLIYVRDALASRTYDVVVGLILMFPATKIGAKFPDMMEPAGGRHRKFWHSILVLIFLIALFLTTLYVLIFEPFYITGPLLWEETILWSIYLFTLGYISHLICDMFTTQRLPWIL